jgi:hypothetical protein
MEHPCKACGQPVVRVNQKRRCPEKCAACHKSSRQERQRQWRDAVLAPSRLAKWQAAKCDKCGCSVAEKPRRGPIPKRCRECMGKQRHDREASRRAACKHKIHGGRCKRCGSEFSSDRKKQKFCSPQCAHLADRRRVTLRCANPECAREYDKCQAQADKGRKFCCWECFQSVHSAPESSCVACGKPFKRKAYTSEWQGKNKYCCRECYLDDRWGKDRPGKASSPAVIDRACKRSLATSLRKRCKHYGVPFDPACTREAVCERDGWVCQQCGVKCHKGRHRFNKTTRKMSKRNAEHDHIVPLARRNPTKGNTFDNSQCLCRRCNGKKHARGGGQMRLALVEC